MVSEPDLFVVCKNCASEVSPYVTECPYCGQRVRKRAPKIERGGEPKEPKTPRRSRTSLPKLRRNEIPGIAVDTRPYGTIALIVLALAGSIAYAASNTTDYGYVYAPLDGEYWRLLATPFLHLDHAGYAFIALVAVGVFGALIERRFGTAFVVFCFLAAGAGGAALAVVLEDLPAVGANGAALGLLAAWLVDDRMAARRGDERDNDLLAVYVGAVVLLLLPIAEPDASYIAGIGGAAVGAVLGAIASPFRP